MTHDERRSEISLYQPELMEGWTLETEAPQGAGQQSLWALIDDRLRGRWLWMLILGAVLAAAFAALGYRSTVPTYQSRGAIRIAPRLIPVLTPIEETGQLPHYQSFLRTQMQYIRSRRVLEHALESDKLKELEWARRTNVLAVLERGLNVVSDRLSELIFVSFEADDPKVAKIVCDAIIESYYEIHGRQGGDETDHNLQRLYDIKNVYERDLRTARADIQGILARHQTTDLRELHAARAQRIEEVDQTIATATLTLERMESQDAEVGASEFAVAGPPMEQLDAIAPRLVQLRDQRDRALSAFEQRKARYRPGTVQYVQAKEWAETAQRLYDEEYTRALAKWDELGLEAMPGAGAEGFFQGLTPSRLRDELATLEARRLALEAESKQILADIQQLSDREFEAERIQADLDLAINRIQGLELEEESIARRISIVQEAAWPHSPHSDARKKRAFAGAAFGLFASFGAFFLLGTIDRRTYGAHQLRVTAAGRRPTKCLGVLPDLGRTLRDPGTGDIASHCVHQIRNQIEVIREPGRGFVLTVSSPFQGDGKTSIVMALGWSYAAAGYRTLLVDCDMVGRALTRQIGMIGREGLKEALLYGKTNGSIANLPVENLSVLPVGVDPSFGPETLRQSDLERILNEARERFEIVIVDTGPLLGSLESTPVTAAADAVVLSLRRGRSRTRLEECVVRLEAAGARCIGVILNGVGRSECSRYVSEASLAAAEGDRRDEQAVDGQLSVVGDTSGERNLLMRAMESRSRPRGQHEQDADDPGGPS